MGASTGAFDSLNNALSKFDPEGNFFQQLFQAGGQLTGDLGKGVMEGLGAAGRG